MKVKRFLAFLFTAVMAVMVFMPLTTAVHGATYDIQIETANAIVENFYIGNKVSQMQVKSADPEKYSVSYKLKDDYPSPDYVLQPGDGFLFEIHFQAKPGYYFYATETLLNGHEPRIMQGGYPCDEENLYLVESMYAVYKDKKYITTANALIKGFYAGYKVSNVRVVSAEPKKYIIDDYSIYSSEGECTPDTVLKANEFYTLDITFKAKSAYQFDNWCEIQYNGEEIMSRGNAHPCPSLLFGNAWWWQAEEKEHIVEVNLTIPEPETGEKPASAIADDTDEGYSVYSTEWTPGCTKFKGGTVYTATIVLKADEEYRFASKTSYRINGQKAKIIKSYWEKTTIAFTFDATEAEPTPEPTEAPPEPTEAPAEPTEAPTEPLVTTEAPEAPQEPTAEPNEPTEIPQEPTAAPEEPTEPSAMPEKPNRTSLETTVVIIVAVLGVLLIAAIVAIIIIVLKRKKS